MTKLWKTRTILQRAGTRYDSYELVVCTVQVTTAMWTHESLIPSHTHTPMLDICTLGYAKPLPTHETHMQRQYLQTTCLTLTTCTCTHENLDLWSWVRVSAGTGMGQCSMTQGLPMVIPTAVSGQLEAVKGQHSLPTNVPVLPMIQFSANAFSPSWPGCGFS